MEEMQDALGLAYAAWSETPGAIEFIKAKLQGKVWYFMVNSVYHEPRWIDAWGG